MSNLEDTVETIVKDFINTKELFTALDVSNKVKAILSSARHREVRDCVRNLYNSVISSQNWSRSPITVTLSDGSTADALLYHPISDTWDLDNKYDQQKRQQTTINPIAAAPIQTQSVVPAPVVAAIPPALPTARQLWDNLFATQSSLFPSK